MSQAGSRATNLGFRPLKGCSVNSRRNYHLCPLKYVAPNSSFSLKLGLGSVLAKTWDSPWLLIGLFKALLPYGPAGPCDFLGSLWSLRGTWQSEALLTPFHPLVTCLDFYRIIFEKTNPCESPQITAFHLLGSCSIAL